MTGRIGTCILKIPVVSVFNGIKSEQEIGTLYQFPVPVFYGQSGDQRFFQTLGVRRNNMGKISSLPKSISKQRISLETAEKKE